MAARPLFHGVGGTSFLPGRIRLLPKKRRHRRSDSQLAGNVGEVAFFAAMLLAGSFVLVALITTRYVEIPGLPVLTRGNGLWLAVIVLISLISIGIVGLVLTMLNVATSAERRSALAQKASDLKLDSASLPPARDFPTVPRNENLVNSPGTRLKYRLPQMSQPTWSLLAILAFALMWNCLLAVFAVVVAESFFKGEPAWILLVMTFLLAAVAGRMTQHFVQRTKAVIREGSTSIEVSDLPWYPGQRFEVCLIQSGRMPLTSLRLMLVCEENATYREGTNVRSETQRVLEQVLWEENGPIDPSPEGDFIEHVEMVLPDQAMHSFRAVSNNVQWKLVFLASVALNEIFERQFPVVVYPVHMQDPV